MIDVTLTNSTYDRLKKTVQLIIPAIGTLYFALAQIWGFPNGEEVLGTITAINTFLGLVLGASSKAYNENENDVNGKMVVQRTNTGGKVFTLELDGDPAELEDQSKVIFKVVDPDREYWDNVAH